VERALSRGEGRNIGQKRETAVHLPLIRSAVSSKRSSSDPAIPRHPERPTYRCLLPYLTEFAGICRAGTKSS
jgi:hypothetical protein